MIRPPKLVKVQIAAEFVADDGEYLSPGVFGPIDMTAREWAEFDLQATIEAGVVAQIRETARKEVQPPADQGSSSQNSHV
jgi:hypothetical protein